jgi:phage terminase small subunit
MSAPAPVTREVVQPDIETRSRLEARAKQAYNLYAEEVYRQPEAFEHLRRDQQEGWRRVVQFFDRDPECGKCGAAILCMTCDSEQVGMMITEALKGNTGC